MIRNVFSKIVDIFLMWVALILSKPYFISGLDQKEMIYFSMKINNIHLLIFSIVVVVLFSVLEENLIIRGIILPPDEFDYCGFGERLKRMLLGIVKLVVIAVLFYIVSLILDRTPYYELGSGILILVAALFVQWAVKGESSVIQRVADSIGDLKSAIDEGIDSLFASCRDTLGSHITNAIQETIIILIPTFILQLLMNISPPKILTVNDGKYCLAALADTYKLLFHQSSLTVPTDGLLGTILNAQMNYFFYSFLWILPFGCAVGGLVCFFSKVGNVAKFSRDCIDSLNSHIDSLPTNNVKLVRKDGTTEIFDFSLHGFLQISLIIVYPFFWIINILSGLLLPLYVVMNLIIGLIFRR